MPTLSFPTRKIEARIDQQYLCGITSFDHFIIKEKKSRALRCQGNRVADLPINPFLSVIWPEVRLLQELSFWLVSGAEKVFVSSYFKLPTFQPLSQTPSAGFGCMVESYSNKDLPEDP